MKSIVSTVGCLMVGGIGGLMAPYLPEVVLTDSIKYASCLVFSSGIASAAAFVFLEKAKGNTKALLDSKSLIGPERLKLAKAINRRSSYLWHRHFAIIVTVGLGRTFGYFHNKGFVQPKLLYISFSLVCIAVASFIPVFLAWRDFIKAKEMLENRDAGIPDLE